MNHSHTYTLTAVLGAERRTVSELCLDTTDATCWGIREVLDRAIDDDVWAKGEINLVGPGGEVLHTMPAKEQA